MTQLTNLWKFLIFFLLFHRVSDGLCKYFHLENKNVERQMYYFDLFIIFQ